jgi:tRNA (guanine37-N1)-methyltransferase
VTYRVDVLTLFPEVIESYAAESVLGRARARDVWTLRTHDLRAETDDAHHTVDDTPFGGGAGMVLRADPIVRTVEATPDLPRPLVALTPSGRPFTQAVAHEYAGLGGITLLCGRYEGFDQRALDLVVDEEVSVGDFVLAGGELAALCVTEAVVRLLPGALGNDDSTAEESFSDGLLEYPHYTKPAEYRGHAVPAVLLSGHHGRVARWRRAMALARTRERRPDLFARYHVTDEDRAAWREVFGTDL